MALHFSARRGYFHREFGTNRQGSKRIGRRPRDRANAAKRNSYQRQARVTTFRAAITLLALSCHSINSVSSMTSSFPRACDGNASLWKRKKKTLSFRIFGLDGTRSRRREGTKSYRPTSVVCHVRGKNENDVSYDNVYGPLFFSFRGKR